MFGDIPRAFVSNVCSASLPSLIRDKNLFALPRHDLGRVSCIYS